MGAIKKIIGGYENDGIKTGATTALFRFPSVQQQSHPGMSVEQFNSGKTCDQ